MLVWMTLVVGSAAIVVGVLVVVQVDRRWRTAHLQCCRCLEVWFSREKMCHRCGARGKDYDWLAVKFAGFPTHDWQGRLDTGPIPLVTMPRPRRAEPEPPAAEGVVAVPVPRAGSEVDRERAG